MTTELVILLSLFAFILFGVFMGENGPRATFEKASPRLGARLERQIETGSGFTEASQDRNIPNGIGWKSPK